MTPLHDPNCSLLKQEVQSLKQGVTEGNAACPLSKLMAKDDDDDDDDV